MSDKIDQAIIDTRPMHAGNKVDLNNKLRLAFGKMYDGYSNGLTPEERLLMVDISHWNGDENFEKMMSAGVVAFYQKATEALLEWIDGTYDRRTGKAQDMGLPYGLYHFVRNLSGIAQAKHFLKKTHRRGVLPMVMDAEVAMPALVLKEFAIVIYDNLGYYPEIYTSNYCWSKIAGGPERAWLIAHCGCFVAHWGVKNPLLPYGYNTYDMHQFGGDNNRRGIEFGFTGKDPDCDVVYARKSWYEKWVKSVQKPPLTLEQVVADHERRIKILESR